MFLKDAPEDTVPVVVFPIDIIQKML